MTSLDLPLYLSTRSRTWSIIRQRGRRARGGSCAAIAFRIVAATVSECTHL
jgi:hypothetical protein